MTAIKPSQNSLKYSVHLPINYLFWPTPRKDTHHPRGALRKPYSGARFDTITRNTSDTTLTRHCPNPPDPCDVNARQVVPQFAYFELEHFSDSRQALLLHFPLQLILFTGRTGLSPRPCCSQSCLKPESLGVLKPEDENSSPLRYCLFSWEEYSALMLLPRLKLTMEYC